MFLEEYFGTDKGRKINKLARESCTYPVMYRYWLDMLFQRVMRLFVWEDTYDEVANTGIPPKEIEQRLIIRGHCGITKYKGELTAMYGSFFGVTKYQDEWKNYNVECPIYSGKRTIDKDVIIINNNSLRNPTFNLIHHYATMLAHNEVSLIMCLINARESGGTPVVSTEKQKASLTEYQNKLFNGTYGIVTDIGNLGLQYMGSDKNTEQDLLDIMECREKLIKSFYSDIGVRSAFEKRNNTVQAEVEADTSLLLLNLSDMLHQREMACSKVNALFDTDWSVHVAEEIDYGAENERMQFDTATETHIVEDENGLAGGEQSAME